MLRAGLDIGTNTLLLLIAEVEQGKIIRVLRDEVRVVRLGEGVDKYHVFQPAALDRARRCFADYADILKEFPEIICKAVATSGSRDAQNSRTFFDEMEPVLGHRIQVVSGEEEANYSFRGALSDRSNIQNYAVIDIGGGSTELVMQGPDGDLLRKSFEVGCVRLTERFLRNDPPLGKEMDELRSYVQNLMQADRSFMLNFSKKQWLGVAGTVTYLASTALGLKIFDPMKVHGTQLHTQEIARCVDRFSQLTSRQRLGVGGMDSGRADVIIAGALILQEFLKAAEKIELEVSVRGLRYGLVL